VWSGTENGHGVTEGGSSGSPIFNSGGQIVGQLTGGGSFCNEVQPGGQNQPDFYGKMSYNWTSNGNTDIVELENFLDPGNTGLTELGGTYVPCAPEALGCIDEEALNYDSAANADDGSCIYPCSLIQASFNITFDCYSEETGWVLTNDADEVVASQEEGFYATQETGQMNTATECLLPGCYTFTMTDASGDGINGSIFSECDTDGGLNAVDQYGNTLFTLENLAFGGSASFDFCVSFDPDIDADGDGFSINEGDCDETNDTVYPNAPELCDGLDNNCNSETDEGLDIPVWYEDADEDGFGNTEVSLTQCDAPEGYVADNTDCDDDNDTIYPGAPELCDGFDNDCNGTEDDLETFPTWYFDGDNDGYGTDDNTLQQCAQPDGYVAEGGDCDDTTADFGPGVEEICDGIDQDCDGLTDEQLQSLLYYEDSDGDGLETLW